MGCTPPLRGSSESQRSPGAWPSGFRKHREAGCLRGLRGLRNASCCVDEGGRDTGSAPLLDPMEASRDERTARCRSPMRARGPGQSSPCKAGVRLSSAGEEPSARKRKSTDTLLVLLGSAQGEGARVNPSDPGAGASLPRGTGVWANIAVAVAARGSGDAAIRSGNEEIGAHRGTLCGEAGGVDEEPEFVDVPRGESGARAVAPHDGVLVGLHVVGLHVVRFNV